MAPSETLEQLDCTRPQYESIAVPASRRAEPFVRLLGTIIDAARRPTTMVVGAIDEGLAAFQRDHTIVNTSGASRPGVREKVSAPRRARGRAAVMVADLPKVLPKKRSETRGDNGFADARETAGHGFRVRRAET